MNYIHQREFGRIQILLIQDQNNNKILGSSEKRSKLLLLINIEEGHAKESESST